MRSTALFVFLLMTAALVPEVQPGHVTENAIGMKLAYVPPGEFTMGSPESERGRIANETERLVKFEKGFRIGVTEVTQKQWTQIMGTNPSFFQGDDFPVERVTWQEAMDFCRRLGAREKKPYRLPTQEEWEYACRAGSKTAYHEGENEAALEVSGWYLRNSGNRSHPVGRKKPNRWGLYDMHGNVSEWCARSPEARDAEPASTRLDSEEKALRDLRGGSWGLNAPDCRSASRHANAGTFRYFDLGLRVVCELDGAQGTADGNRAGRENGR